jgi:hypothetical protein
MGNLINWTIPLLLLGQACAHASSPYLTSPILDPAPPRPAPPGLENLH